MGQIIYSSTEPRFPDTRKVTWDKILQEIVAGAGSGGGGGPSSLPTTLRSYYKMDEASGDALDVHSGNHGVDNGTVGTAAGKIGTARLFVAANSEFFAAGDSALIDFSTAFTLSAWIYGDNLTANAAIAAKWNFGGAADRASWAIQLGAVATNLRVFIADSGTDAGNNFVDFTGGLTDDTWHHIVVVYDGLLAAGLRVALYVNNVAKSPSITGTIAASLPNSTAVLRIGDFQGLSRFWQGRLDEIGLWGRALTTAEIAELYNAGAGKAYPFL